MANVFDTAKYILEKMGTMSTMKLQKLCYYSQAWSLVWDDRPLFNEEFRAWANGPVCYELFRKTQGQFSVKPHMTKVTCFQQGVLKYLTRFRRVDYISTIRFKLRHLIN